MRFSGGLLAKNRRGSVFFAGLRRSKSVIIVPSRPADACRRIKFPSIPSPLLYHISTTATLSTTTTITLLYTMSGINAGDSFPADVVFSFVSLPSPHRINPPY
jgi:hypothetical protein